MERMFWCEWWAHDMIWSRLAAARQGACAAHIFHFYQRGQKTLWFCLQLLQCARSQVYLPVNLIIIIEPIWGRSLLDMNPGTLNGGPPTILTGRGTMFFTTMNDQFQRNGTERNDLWSSMPEEWGLVNIKLPGFGIFIFHPISLGLAPDPHLWQ